jgi:hypothetical protein
MVTPWVRTYGIIVSIYTPNLHKFSFVLFFLSLASPSSLFSVFHHKNDGAVVVGTLPLLKIVTFYNRTSLFFILIPNLKPKFLEILPNGRIEKKGVAVEISLSPPFALFFCFFCFWKCELVVVWVLQWWLVLVIVLLFVYCSCVWVLVCVSCWYYGFCDFEKELRFMGLAWVVCGCWCCSGFGWCCYCYVVGLRN